MVDNNECARQSNGADCSSRNDVHQKSSSLQLRRSKKLEDYQKVFWTSFAIEDREVVEGLMAPAVKQRTLITKAGKENY